jgi:hypothetical protein
MLKINWQEINSKNCCKRDWSKNRLKSKLMKTEKELLNLSKIKIKNIKMKLIDKLQNIKLNRMCKKDKNKK